MRKGMMSAAVVALVFMISTGACATEPKKVVNTPSGLGYEDIVVGTGEVRHEKEIEVGQVVEQAFTGEDDIACQPAIRRRLQTHAIGQGLRGGSRLRHRADAADARCDDQGIVGGLAQQHALEATVERCIDPRFLHDAVGNLQGDLEVTLGPVERTDQQAAHFIRVRFWVGGTTV